MYPFQSSKCQSRYNNAARPFQNGNEPVKSIVNKQYNTPVGIYSEESIAETLSAQAEVLAGGVLGVNFKKNEKVYNSAGSEVLKALQESENDPADPAGTNFYWTASHAVGGAASALSRSLTPSQLASECNKNGNVTHEEPKSGAQKIISLPPKLVTVTPAQPSVAPNPDQSAKVSPCDECGASIVGVFVRIKDKNLHVDCFKCATCGTSLKNQGYFNLNNKLYCDIHAKMAAINHPPPGTEGYKPVPIAPNTKLSASTISAALNAHHGNLPHQNGTSHNNNHDFSLPNHSRTSSSASSFGSSYVSSTDSNKASPSTISPVHSRQGSQNSTTSNLSLGSRPTVDEIDKNVINASYHNSLTLPRYQSVFNAQIKGFFNNNVQKPIILDDKTYKDETFNGKSKNGYDESIYGTIRNMGEEEEESEDVIYRTMDGSVIRSVHPPGKGKGTNYKLPSNLGSPKPYSYGSGPPPAGPKSPSSYPPPNWSQPKPQAYAPPQQTYTPPQPTYTPSKPTFAPTQNYSSPSSNLGSNTLPRPVGQSAPDSVDEFSRPSTSAFSWPPPPDDDHDLPTASPLYVAPPETQRVQVKTINYSENVDKPTVAWTAQQSRSAPELTIHNLKEHNEAESCSESYTSTCTTTTTTSEEYQKMYRAHQAEFGCDLSVSDMDYHADAEMASMAQQYGSFSSASTDLISFAGRKSVQECTDALSNKVDTCQLVRYIKELESANQKPVKKVEFADPVHEAINDNKKISKMEVMLPPPSPKPLPPSNISNPVPKEWTSLMVQALTTAPSQPYHVSEIQIESCNLPCQQINTQNDVCYKTCPGKESCDQVSCSSVEIGKVERQENIKTSTNLTQTENVQNGAYNYNQGENNFLRLSDASCSNHTIEEAHFAKEEPLQRSYMSSGLTVASPYPVEWTKPFEEPVPLPEETVPYFPPPIDMSPYEKSDYGKKSPFIDALTTAPFRSYTPFEHDVITQLEDLPTPTQQLSMIDALTVAPTNSYHELNQELPEVTPNEQILLDEKERLERQAKEVSEIIAQTIESQMDKQISAFAKFSGFRSVHPFKPKQDSIAVATVSAGTQSTEVSEVNESKNLVTSTYSSSEAHSAQNAVSFPPPPAVKCKSYVQSGLHIPKTIPKYQRQWFNLPSQSPIRTPEPPELKENVPLAFVDVPHETSESVQKPVAVTVSSASITKETQSYSVASQSQQYRTTVSTTIPSIKEFRTEPVSMPFESLDDHHERERAVSPYRAHTPSMINKPAPAIPYYQQNLVAEECSATSSLLFDPRIQSPNPDRAKSPAPGPPPNPLRIHAPRIKSPDLTERYDTNTQSIDTSISNQYSTLPTLSHYQTFNQSGLQSYVAKPEVVKQTQSENVSIQSRSTESHLNDQNRSDFRSSSTAQIGNTQIQRNTRVVEEFEHSQKVKTIEVYKSSGGPPIRSITAEPAVIQPTVSKTSCFLQRAGSIQPDHAEEKVNVKSSGPGFVAREARRLSTNSQYKADLAEYQSSFPKLTCETSPSAFPIKNFHPIMEEPKFQAYNVNKRAGESAPPPGYQQIPKAILTKSTQQLSKKLSQVTDSSASSTLTSGTTAMTQSISSSTPYKPPIAIPVPAFKPPIPSANDFKPTQSAANNFKPTSSSGPGFKPPNTTIPSAVVNNTTPASAGPNKGLTFGATSAPKRGRGILSKAPGPGGRIPQCGCLPPPLPKSSPPKFTSAEPEKYKTGHATELLEESVKNLKVAQQEDFRSNAGKIISFMLENRLADAKNGVPNRYESGGNPNDMHLFKKITDGCDNGPSPTSKAEKSIGYDNKPLLSPTLVKANSPDINDNLTNFPLPPPTPSADDINSNSYLTSLPSPPPPPPLSEELDPPVFNYKYFSTNKPRSPSKSSSVSPKSVENENIHDNVVVRNKDSKSELSTHARDRRSYIEKDMLGNDNYVENIVSELDTTDLSNELKNGKQPVCTCCKTKITRGPFITALGRIWCPDHFVCVSQNCRRPLADIGFVEEKGELYCEYCFEKYLAPPCDKCGAKIKGDCLNAIGKHYHPECFVCTYCGKLFGNSPFFLEEGQAYCETDWNELFTTKCFACGFPVEAGDRWVEALSHNYHSQCFNCTTCKKNLEGQSFFAKGGRPFCKNHAR
ncbi:PDZ and LIM domain protein Zasp [Pseudolycoriella hygida]|uniref:PDZ and LIM domain protein Zasp n=1 Tax=Pseudolycoriella hygida TaxID=35572 RepID=A0A9Q0N3U0_9DIPT|nr:PDZ and LIM domain protein Zasp [Pseudolycoriella hygida]